MQFCLDGESRSFNAERTRLVSDNSIYKTCRQPCRTWLGPARLSAYIAFKVGQIFSAYRAAVRVGAGFGDELSILVFAGSAKVVTLDLDVEVELLVGGRGVLEDREPFAVVLADTEVDGGPVTGVTGAVTPLAALLSRNTGRVDIVLGRGGLALPVVVSRTVGASQWLGLAAVEAEGNGFTFSTCLYELAKATLVTPNNPRTHQGSQCGTQRRARR